MHLDEYAFGIRHDLSGFASLYPTYEEDLTTLGNKEIGVMKTKVFYLNLQLVVLLFCILSTLYLPNSFAQNYTQMGLPEHAKARLGKGHIQHMLYSPDGNTLAVATSIGIWLYDTKTYQELNLLPIPMNKNRANLPEIINTTFSVDGETIVSDTNKNIVYVWDVTSGENRTIFKGDEVYFSLDRKTFTIEKENKTVQLFQEQKINIDYSSFNEKDKKLDSIAFSPDGKTFATTHDDDYTVKIRDLGTRKLRKKLTGYMEFIYLHRITLSPDGRTLATLRWGSPIHLWDVTTGNLKKTLTGYKVMGRPNPNLNLAHYVNSTVVDYVAFSPDGKTLANGSQDGSIRLWNIASGKLKKRLIEHQGFINGLAFSPDGTLLASGSKDGLILMWNLETGTHKAFLAERMGIISCVAFSGDGSMLAAGNTYGNIHLFDIAAGIPKMTFTGHVKEITQVLFSSDGDTLASRSYDGSVRLWNIHTGKSKMTLSTPIENYWGEMLFTDNGKLLTIRGEFDFIHLWNVTDGQYQKILMGHTSFIKNLSLSTDKQTLASQSADGTILLWDMTAILNTTD